MRRVIQLITLLVLVGALPERGLSQQIVLECAAVVPGATLATNGTIGAVVIVGEPAVGTATNGTTVIEWGAGNCDATVASSVSPAAPVKTAEIHSWPNPAERSARIEITMMKSERVTVNVYDAAGMLKKTIFSGTWESGKHQLDLSAIDMAAGTYFVAVEMPNQVVQHPITITK